MADNHGQRLARTWCTDLVTDGHLFFDWPQKSAFGHTAHTTIRCYMQIYRSYGRGKGEVNSATFSGG